MSRPPFGGLQQQAGESSHQHTYLAGDVVLGKVHIRHTGTSSRMHTQLRTTLANNYKLPVHKAVEAKHSEKDVLVPAFQ